MDQPRLFRLAPEAVVVAAQFRPREGWHLRVQVRRGDESWDEAGEHSYWDLTTAELFDVVCADLAGLLGL